MHNKNQPKLLIINGPFCSDKYYAANIFAQVYRFIHIDGKALLKEIKEKNRNKTITYNDIHADILREISKQLNQEQDVVVSQTILPSYGVLYNYYFQKHKIESEMIILLPTLNSIFKNNNDLEKPFDEDYLEEMYQLFNKEEPWKNKCYQYNGNESTTQIAETLYMCFYPQKQKQLFLDTPFAIQENKDKITFHLHSTSKSIKVCE